MSTRKRQKKRKARSRKNKQPAVTLKTNSIPQKPKPPVEEKAKSNTTPKAPPTKDVITDPKSTSENNDSAKILLDGESDNDQSDEVDNTSTDENPSLLQVANGSKGNGWLKTKKFGRYFITTIEVLAAAFVIPTAYVLIVDLEDRQSQRIAQAWGLVTQHAPGNSGKIEALEYLNSDDCEHGTAEEPSKWEMIQNCSWLAALVPPKRRVNLNGVDLSEDTHKLSVYLNGLDLSYALLSKANFKGANIQDLNLSDANMSYANFSEVELYRAKLSNIFLWGSNFHGADILDSDMRGVKLTDSIFENGSIQHTDLSDSFLDNANFSGANFHMSTMTRVKAFNSNFIGAYFLSSDVTLMDFSGSDLRSAWIYHSKLVGADFSNAQFSESIPYRVLINRESIMGREYDIFPWPINAKSGAVYKPGRPPFISESLLAYFSEVGDTCVWPHGSKYVECAGYIDNYERINPL